MALRLLVTHVELVFTKSQANKLCNVPLMQAEIYMSCILQSAWQTPSLFAIAHGVMQEVCCPQETGRRYRFDGVANPRGRM